MRIGEHNTLCSGRTHSAFELNTSCSLLVHYDNGQTSLRWELNSPIAMRCSWLPIPLKFLSSIKSASERETKHFVAMGNIADPSALCYRQTVWSASSELNKILQLVQWLFNNAWYNYKFLSNIIWFSTLCFYFPWGDIMIFLFFNHKV